MNKEELKLLQDDFLKMRFYKNSLKIVIPIIILMYFVIKYIM